jgi:hypothetical protein
MDDVKLDAFQERVNRDRARYNAIVAWHLQAYTNGGISLPYTPDSTYISVDFSTPVYPDNKKPVEVTEDNPKGWEYNWESVKDEAAIIDFLRKVTKFARKLGYKVEKDYSHDFSLKVTIPEDERKNQPAITLSYFTDRETVCTKKVVGTTVVPARVIPEKVEEVIEWDCQKIALTA